MEFLSARRFPDSLATYLQADLFALPDSFAGAFDLVVEVYTVQAMPPELRSRAMACLAATVAPGGRLVAIMRGREDDAEVQHVPWPLSREEIEGLDRGQLQLTRFEDLMDEEEPPVRRFRIELRS